LPSLPAGAYQPASISFRDAGNERASFRCYGPVLTNTNIVAQNALWATLIDTIDAITLGAIVSTRFGDKITAITTQPTNGAAREIALLVQVQDMTTGATDSYRIPTLDPTIPDYVINKNVKDGVLLDSPTEISDFVAAFNAFAVDPLAPANHMTVVGLKVVRGGK